MNTNMIISIVVLTFISWHNKINLFFCMSYQFSLLEGFPYIVHSSKMVLSFILYCRETH